LQHQYSGNIVNLNLSASHTKSNKLRAKRDNSYHPSINRKNGDPTNLKHGSNRGDIVSTSANSLRGIK